MIIDAIIDNVPTSIINIYAPNQYEDRSNFFSQVTQIEILPEAIFLGDFNQPNHPQYDKFPPNDTHTQGWEAFSSFKSCFNLIDCFNPTRWAISDMTRIRSTKNKIISASRIDLILATPSTHLKLCYKGASETHISDHRLVSSSINMSLPTHSMAKWHKVFPFQANSLLLSKFIKKKIQKHPNDISAANWASIKKKITGFNAKSGFRRKNATNAEIKRLKNHLTHLKNNMPLHPSSQWNLDWCSTTAKLKSLSKTNDHILFLQAGAKWIAMGERPTRFFNSLFSSRKKSTYISELNVDGKLTSDVNALSRKTYDFYSELYTSSNDSPDNAILLSSDTLDPLDDELQSLLSVPITCEELTPIIEALPSRKSPGPDGLPYEIYKVNIKILLPLLLHLFNSIIDSSIPLQDSGENVITTLFKKGDPSDLANWRPIAFSNTDSKIFSKCIAKRLGTIAISRISPHQFGFVPGRQIWDNVQLINNILQSNHKTGALIFIDQEKAYDRVDWSFLLSVLTQNNFPLWFIKWIKNYLSSTSIKIRTPTFLTPSILPTRGLRQGDPISPILYNLCLIYFLEKSPTIW